MAQGRVATFRPFGASGRPYEIINVAARISPAIGSGLEDEPRPRRWLKQFVPETAR